MLSLIIICSFIVLTAYFFLVRTFIHGWDKIRCLENPQENPKSKNIKVSILIAVRNEQENINNLVNSFKEQNYPKENLEIIFVDDHSQDETVNRIEACQKMNTSNIGLIEMGAHHGKKASLSKGVLAANGELIVFTDADCSFGKNWISSIVSHYNASNFKLAILPVLIKQSKTIFNKVQVLEFLSLMGSALAATANNRSFMCSGANLVVERKAFLNVGGYSKTDQIDSGDDVFLLHKVKEKYGEQTIHALVDEELIVTTTEQSGISSFVNQRARWASKAKYYKDKFSTYVSWLVLIVNLVPIVLIVSSFFAPINLLWALGFVLLKMIIDYFFLRELVLFFQRKLLLGSNLILSELFYLYYVPAVVIKILSGKISWKGRALKY